MVGFRTFFNKRNSKNLFRNFFLLVFVDRKGLNKEANVEKIQKKFWESEKIFVKVDPTLRGNVRNRRCAPLSPRARQLYTFQNALNQEF